MKRRASCAIRSKLPTPLLEYQLLQQPHVQPSHIRMSKCIMSCRRTAVITAALSQFKETPIQLHVPTHIPSHLNVNVIVPANGMWGGLSRRNTAGNRQLCAPQERPNSSNRIKYHHGNMQHRPKAGLKICEKEKPGILPHEA